MKKTVFLFLTFYILQIFGCFKNAKKKSVWRVSNDAMSFVRFLVFTIDNGYRRAVRCEAKFQ